MFNFQIKRTKSYWHPDPLLTLLKNIFVVNGENFIKTPWIELNKLEKFLNVTQFIRKRHFHFDINKNFFCLKESVMMPSSKMNESYFKASTSSLHGEFDGCLGKTKGRKNHVFLSRFVRNELKKYFVKWNKLFFKLVGQNFDWWNEKVSDFFTNATVNNYFCD